MQRNFLAGLFFLIICLLIPASETQAGEVTLEISTTTGIKGSIVTAGFRITNKGTDPAFRISLLGSFQKEQQNVFIAERLGPGQGAESSASFAVPAGLQGSYPLFITVSYEHADGIPVSSASIANVVMGEQGKSALAVKAVLEEKAGSGEISIHLKTDDPALEHVTVTGHGPGDLAIEPPVQEIRLENGTGRAQFNVTNISGSEGSVYGVFFAAQYELQGLNHLATSDIAVPVKGAGAVITPVTASLNTWFYGFALIVTAVCLIILIISRSARQWLFSLRSVPHLLDIFVLASVEIFIFSKFDLASLFTATITTGGDTASHYYTLEYLRHTLLPSGKVSGWTMGNYGGFPILQFYFPLPFLIMCLLDLVMPLQVAFKLVTMMGTALLPLAAFTMLRLLRCPFPGPGIGAVLMLPFLFNGANSMWGGNILSTLAGEFSYSFSMALSLILIGSLYRGATENKWIIRNAILVFLVGFSHGYTLLFAEAMSLFLLLTPYGFSRRLLYLFRVYALGFCLLAFWLVPLLVFTKYTTAYHLVWTINSLKEVVPDILLPGVIAGIAGSIILLATGIIHYRDKGKEILVSLAYLWFGLGVAVIFFVAAPRIGVVDIRYVPYGQLMVSLMGALFLGWAAKYMLKRWGLSWLLLIVVSAAVMHWTDSRVGPVSGWFKWNYEGFEAKKTWPVFDRVNKALAGDFQDPRVVFEHSQDHNAFGSSRAFESLPLFAGRATLEGLYMQASITAPFVFYIQSLVSRQSSQPFPQYSYTNMDLNRAREYLKLFNVGELILKSSPAKGAVRQISDYSRVETIGQYELWKLTTNTDRYIEVLQFEPFVYRGKEPWKQIAHKWFTHDDLLDIHLVSDAESMDNKGSPLTRTARSLEDLSRHEIDISACTVQETIKAQEIFLQTSCPGKPHLVKVSYHPNWHVEGADRIYLTSPSFMLIYPKENKVRLFYGPGPWDRTGQLLTLFGLVVLLLNIPIPGKNTRTAWSMLEKRLGLPTFENVRFSIDPSPFARRITMMGIFMIAVIMVAAVSYRTYVNEPYRAYNRSIRYKDAGRYDRARSGFQRFMRTYPLSSLAQESSYYIGITYFLEKKDTEALKSFEDFLKRYPRGNRVAEVEYHMGLILLRSGKLEDGRRKMQQLIGRHPGTQWAAYAKERLQEHGFTPSGEQVDIDIFNLQQYMGRAITYFNLDMLDEAKPILLQISQRFPDFEGAPQALAALALCYYKEGDCADTIKYYKRLVERYPDHKLAAEAYFHLGVCYERTGNTILAENAYRKVVEIDPGGAFGKQAKSKIGQ